MDPKEQFIHRELSWLAFNERVLEEAEDLTNPLLERLKFIAIYANNLDEFYMVRVAGIKRLIDARYKSTDEYGYTPEEVSREIEEYSGSLTRRLYAGYDSAVNTELKKNKIFLKKYGELNAEEKKHAQAYFESTLFPVMTPMAVDQGHPLPNLPSKTIAFSITVEREGKPHFIILPVPNVVSRVVQLPSASGSGSGSGRGESNFILIDEIIRNNLGVFCTGYKVMEQALFRLMRDSDIELKEEYTEDLLKAIEKQIRKRPQAKVVCLEVEKNMTQEMLGRLCKLMGAAEQEVKKVDNHLDLTFLFDLVNALAKSKLLYKDFKSKELKYAGIFERVKKGDFLVHMPYQSFKPVLDFIQEAARDKKTLAIKMTLYRTSGESAFIAALKEAAANKKQVTVLVELRARFEEEKNILWAKELEDAGCHVIYGIPSVKIHSKIALVVRKEENRIRRYVYLSTGNYNEKTARTYTDIGFFTAREDYARDISDVFNVLTGYSMPPKWKKVVSAPYDLRKYFMELIDNEIQHQKKNENGMIFAKMNSLADNQIIEKLYEASCAGVKIRLLVRGMCCLVPGVKDLSEHIEVRSVVGRFLEHSRIYFFNNNNNPKVFLSSADWMTRNFDRRIELLFPVDNEELQQHLKWILDLYWKDNVKSRALCSDRKYLRNTAAGQKLNAQEYLIEYYLSPSAPR